MKRRIMLAIAVSAVLALGAGLLATPALGATTHHTVAQFQTFMKGQWSDGPNQYTNWQRVQITGSHKDPCFNYYDTDDVMHQYANPALAVHNAPADPAAACPVAARVGGVPVMMASWYNPFSWDWGHILSSIWNTIWDNCLKGATTGLVGTATGKTIFNLLTKGAKFEVGPGGWVVLGIGGCIASISW